MSAFRIQTSSSVPYQDSKTEGLTLMIVESGHIICAMSQQEVRKIRKSVLLCHLFSAYNQYILSVTRLVGFQIHLSLQNIFKTIGSSHQMITYPNVERAER